MFQFNLFDKCHESKVSYANIDYKLITTLRIDHIFGSNAIAND